MDSAGSFTVERAGVPVAHLQRYLGALGHLVTRASDLAYLPRRGHDGNA
jgi:hypothetical protein